jgi:undecaprenyl-diphosphatase
LLDHHVEHWIVSHRIGSLDWVFIWLSRIGNFGLVWLAVALALAAVTRRLFPALLVAVVVAVAELEASLGKVLIARARPHDNPLIAVPHTHAFPSGHALTSFAAATVLARFVPRLRVPFFVLAAAIAYSRVYNGVHWPSDVLAGAGLGVATALLLLAAVRRAPRRARPAG